MVTTTNLRRVGTWRHKSLPPKYLQHHLCWQVRKPPPVHSPQAKVQTSLLLQEADGTRFGDFEMDLIVDSFGHAILTLTERLTNMVFIEKLKDGKKAEGVVKAVRRLLLPYKDKVLTITADNGPEFAEHLKITQWLGAKVYFADPYSSWQKGAIKNANKLIRQVIPKSANFNDYTDKRIKGIQHKLNRRPRQKLNFSTPKIEFYKRIN